MKNIGIMGLGKISHRVAKGIAYAHNAQLYAVASRNIAHAQDFQKQHPCPKAYGSYEELLHDPQVDMVYICTSNYLHYTHIMACLQHHKHVVCEKPFVANHEQVVECFTFAKKQGCFLMEAEKTIFTPLNQTIQQMIQDGAIGQLRYIEASYGYDLGKENMPDDFWGYRQEDGGCSYDVGVYPLVYANFFANSRLVSCKDMVHLTQKGYDDFMQCLLQYENGIMASIRSCWNMTVENKGFLYGDNGYIVCENFWKNTEALLVKEDGQEKIQVCMESDFTPEIEHAVDCMEQGLLESPLMSQAASMEVMRVLDQIKGRTCVGVK